jgi:peptidoglycan/xylan/chitin deacetylase (PgdA/CDA1 family)
MSLQTPILMYHEVTDYPEKLKSTKKIDPEYSLPTQKFEEQIAYLYTKGYNILSIDDVARPQTMNSKTCAITFDDGYIGNFNYAYPVLRKYGYSATFFISTKYISLLERLMNWDQLRELASRGFSIQSHTVTHPALEELQDKDILYELSESKKKIQDEIGKEVKYLSLPFGSYKRNVTRIAQEVGYAGVLTSFPFSRNWDLKPVLIGRIPIKASYDIHRFQSLIKNQRALFYRMKIGYFIKRAMKKGIGISNYRRIYRFAKNVEALSE